ncbi:MAG: hypothetical protein QW228_09080 [Candidatus Aenigmatarchaeota archaeon]
MRLGRHFRKLARKLPDSESALLWSKRNGKLIYEGFAELFRLKGDLKNRVEEKILLVESLAKQKGEKVRHTWHSCGDISCAVCQGKNPEHLHVKVVEGENIALEEWLSSYWPAEDVLSFVALLKNYENLCVILRYETMLLQNLGLLEG